MDYDMILKKIYQSANELQTFESTIYLLKAEVQNLPHAPPRGGGNFGRLSHSKLAHFC